MDLLSGVIADAIRSIASRLRSGESDLLRRALVEAVRNAAVEAGAAAKAPEPVVDLLTRDDNLLAIATLTLASSSDRDVVPELRRVLADVDWVTAGIDEAAFLRHLVPAARDAVIAAGRAGGPLGFVTLNLRLDDLQQQLGPLPVGPPKEESTGPVLPPGIPELLEQMRTVGDEAYTPLLHWLHGSTLDKAAVQALIHEPPKWLSEGSPRTWRLLGDLAQAYDDFPDAVLAYLRAADEGAASADRLRARAAYMLFTLGQDNTQQLDAIADSADPFVSIVRAAARQEWSFVAAHDRVDESEPADRLFLQLLHVIALVQLGNWQGAREQAMRLHEDSPDAPGVALLAAKTILGDVEAGGGEVHRHEAIRTAFQLAIQARDARRAWGGTSEEAVEVAAQAAVLLEDFDRVLSLCLPPPQGAALSREASHPGVRATAAHIAAVTGRLELAGDLAKGLTGPSSDLVRAAIAEAERDDVTTERLARGVLEGSQDLTYRGQAALALAGIGKLQPADTEGLAEREAVMLAALNFASQQRDDEAYALLRQHEGAIDNARFERLRAMLLARSGQLELAADRLEQAAIRYGDPTWKVAAAQYRVQAGDWESARVLALEAASAVEPRSPQWVDAHRLLIELAARQSEWRNVEQSCRAVLDVDPTDVQARWALALALFNRRRASEAWDALSANDAVPEAATPWHAHLLVNLLVELQPTRATARTLLALADRFHEDERLRAHVIMSLVQLPDEEFDGDAALVQRAQEHAADFLETYPDSPFLRSIPADDEDELIRRLRAMLMPAAERWRTAAKSVAQGAPCGLLAAAAGRPYAAIWPHRAAGHIPMTASDVHAADRADLTGRSAQVLVDASTLHTLALLPELWPHVRVLTKELATTEDAADDVLRARDSFVLQSAGSMAWDLDADKLTMTEAEESTSLLLRERANKMAEGLRWLKTIPWRQFTHFKDFDEGPFRAWIGLADLSIAQGATLYCDDVGLRRFTRENGGAAFDTTAVIDALHESGQLDDEARDRLYMTLASEFVVDLPQSDALLKCLLARDGFESLPAAYMLSRPAYWMDDPQQVATSVRLLLAQAADEQPALAPRWAAMAAVGLARTRGVRAAMALIVQQVLISEDNSTRASLYAAAKSVAREVEEDDPTPILVQILRDVMTGVVPTEDEGRLILGLFSDLPDPDRQAVVAALLALGPKAQHASDADAATKGVSTVSAQATDARARLARRLFGNTGA